MRKAFLIFSLLTVSTIVMAEDEGTTAAPTLSRTSAARPVSLGGAFVAADGEVDGVFYNPAAIASLTDPAVQSTYQKGLSDDSLGGLDAAVPVGFGTLYAGGAYYDAGTIDVNLSNGVNETRRAQQDVVGGLGLAIGRRGPLAAGVVVKGYRLVLAEDARASGVAFDAGVLVRTPLSGLSLGLSAVNTGSDVKFESSADPLPTTIRAGAAYVFDVSRMTPFRSNPYVFSLFADAVSERRVGASGRGGLEMTRKILTMDKSGTVSLRGGYQSEPRTITAGVGLRLASFGLDYAFSVVENVDSSHRLTLSWHFISSAEDTPVFRQRGR